MRGTVLQPILLNMILENLSRLQETSTFISAWAFECKQHILILDYLRGKKKLKGSSWKLLEYWESGAEAVRSRTVPKLQCRLAREFGPRATVRALAMHLSSWHKWPQTLGTAAGPAALLFQELDFIVMASNAREALPGSLLPCIFSLVVEDQSRWIWWSLGHVPTY